MFASKATDEMKTLGSMLQISLINYIRVVSLFCLFVIYHYDRQICLQVN